MRIDRIFLPLPVLLVLAGQGPSSFADTLPEKARLCVSERKEEAVRACREALGLGLPSARARIVRSVLAAELVDLKRWEEAVDVYREQDAQRPGDPEAHFQLASALLFLVNRPAEAIPEFQAGLRLSPRDARAYGALGVALAALDQHPEAVAAFTEAARLDPEYFDSRPAARQIHEASQRGEHWP